MTDHCRRTASGRPSSSLRSVADQRGQGTVTAVISAYRKPRRDGRPSATTRAATLLVLLAFVGAACAPSRGDTESSVPAPTQEATPTSAPDAATPAETTGTATPSTQPPFAEQQGQGPGTEAAFDELREAEDGRIVRWRRPTLTVSVSGTATVVDLATLDTTIAAFSALAGLPELVRVDRQGGDIDLNFLEKDRWADVMEGIDADDTVDGQARYVHDDGVISEASIVVDSASNQYQRNRTIVHEMLHALGLGHHSCRGGLLYGGAEYDPRWDLRQYDTVLLEAWYREHGDEPDVGIDLPCPEVAWDSVLFEGQVLWCRTGGRDCYPVDARTGALTEATPLWLGADGSISDYDPDLFVKFRTEDGDVLCRRAAVDGYQTCELGALQTIVDADRWFDGATIYDYHPGTHIARFYEDRRLLCEKPSPGGPRTPCQFTSGAVLTGADLYTDGQFVYSEP